MVPALYLHPAKLSSPTIYWNLHLDLVHGKIIWSILAFFRGRTTQRGGGVKPPEPLSKKTVFFIIEKNDGKNMNH